MNREDWNYLSINECAEVIGGGTPSTKNPNYWDGNIPWISPKDLSNNKDKYISNGERFITQVGLEKSSAKLLPVNSLLFSSRAPIGYLAINTKPVATNQGFKSLILKEEFDVEFFYYLFKDKTEYIKNFASGSTFQEVSGSVVKNLSFLIPPKQEQKRISNILSKLDKKIELNLKMNETLEDIAKTLFKSWFIDFDPVRAKAEGRPTGLSKEISDLFPDAFEVSQSGEIPKGWQVYNLESVFDFLEGPGIRNWQYTDEENGVNFINIRCIKNGDLDLSSASKITEDEAYGKYSHFQLMPDDMVVSCSGTLGKFAFVRNSHIPLNLNTSVIRFRPKRELTNINFLEGFIRTQLQRELEIRATGSAQRNFGPTHLKEIETIVPKKEIMNLFGEILHPLLRKRILNLDQNDILIGLRNTLLPKLISGELKITDAESLIEEAGI